MYMARVSANGRIVIPKPLREKYGLKEGSQVQVVDCGSVLAVVPLPVDPVEALCGMLAGGSSPTGELLAARAEEWTKEESRCDPPSPPA